MALKCMYNRHTQTFTLSVQISSLCAAHTNSQQLHHVLEMADEFLIKLVPVMWYRAPRHTCSHPKQRRQYIECDLYLYMCIYISR